MGNYRPFLQGPLPVANYTRIIIPGRFWTRPPSTKSTRIASSATPLHDSLIELAIPDAHAHAIKWYLKTIAVLPHLPLSKNGRVTVVAEKNGPKSTTQSSWMRSRAIQCKQAPKQQYAQSSVKGRQRTPRARKIFFACP